MAATGLLPLGGRIETCLGKWQRLEPNSPETLLALGYYQYCVLRDYGLAKTTFGRVSKLLRSGSEVPLPLLHRPREGLGIKVLPISSEPSRWIHVMWR